MVLPGNHLHTILTLPEGDARYSARWERYYTSINGYYNGPAGIYRAYAPYCNPQTTMGSISTQY
jgi:REP element-mobilizing transposase RayT